MTRMMSAMIEKEHVLMVDVTSLAMTTLYAVLPVSVYNHAPARS